MGLDTNLTRKDFLLSSLGVASFLSLPATSRANLLQAAAQTAVTEADIKAMEKVIGIELKEEFLKAVAQSTKELRDGYAAIRALKMPNSVPPSCSFVPQGLQPKESKDIRVRTQPVKVRDVPTDEDLAFLTVAELASLIKNRKLTSQHLTEICLKRLETYGPKLLNVITMCRERAMKAAELADREIARGRYRGSLHGIPYAIKDLFSAANLPTTWGAEPFENQVFDYDAEIVRRLEDAGAVLCAKTSVGALAMDDHWFRGKTKNPWNPAQGSSGSSAGSASCMAAGLVPFTIGTETLGSIMSPSHRCRVTGLRPTYGRVSRRGGMALTWSMDKVGPICRTAEDCALVLAAICGRDPHEISTVDRPFNYRHDLDLKKVKIASLADDAALDEDDSGGGPDDALKLLKSFGMNPVPLKITKVTPGVDLCLVVEAAAAFDEITLDGRVDTIKSSFWPALFRQHEFATGVGYVNAMRARSITMDTFEREYGDFDVILASDRGSHLLFTTNLTGHPQLYVPFGKDSKGASRGISLFGRLYDEGTILAIGQRIQNAMKFHRERPDLSKV